MNQFMIYDASLQNTLGFVVFEGSPCFARCFFFFLVAARAWASSAFSSGVNSKPAKTLATVPVQI